MELYVISVFIGVRTEVANDILFPSPIIIVRRRKIRRWIHEVCEIRRMCSSFKERKEGEQCCLLSGGELLLLDVSTRIFLRLNGNFGLTIIDSDEKCSAGLFLMLVPAPLIVPNLADAASFVGQSAKCYEKDLPQTR